MVHGRSPLGYLRQLRVLMFVIPLMTLLVLAMGGRRFNGSFINPASQDDIRPIILPFLLIAAIITGVVRSAVTPETAMPWRYAAICLAFLFTMAAFWLGVVYYLAGGPQTWILLGALLAIGTARGVSLARLAADVSGTRS